MRGYGQLGEVGDKVVYNKHYALCPVGVCTGFCTTPLCGRPRTGDCTGAYVCKMPHAYPPEFQFESLLGAWQVAADRVTSSLVQQALTERDMVVEAQEEHLVKLEGQVFRPDWRFFVGLGLVGAGVYFFRKKGR